MTLNKSPGDETPEEVAQALKTAELRLRTFEESITDDTLLARLATERAAHPLLLAYKLLLALLSIGISLAFVALAMPLISYDILARIAHIEARIQMPVPMVLTVLAFCFGGLAAGVRQLAVSRGRNSPMLPHERKVYQGLSNEMHRLKSAKSLEDNKYITY